MSSVEIAGFVFGVAGVWLTLRENVWCFPVGLINVILSLFLFYQQKLYADTLQQFVYIILLSYGWFMWLKGTDDKMKNLPVSLCSNQTLLMCGFAFVISTTFLGVFLSKLTDAIFPWLDSAATSISFVAQWMIAKKKIENWLLWILVNMMYIGIYSSRHLWLYSLLFTVYLALAIIGYLRWKSELKKSITV